jgi:mRNA interferase RelE/StbE
MNRPIFRDQRTATLDGEVICYGDQSSALNELNDFWSPNRDRICAPPPPRYSQPDSSPTERGPFARSPKRVWPMHQEAPAISPVSPKTPQEPVPQFMPAQEQTRSAENWSLGFANSFRKAVDSIDRKLQGRILQAIAEDIAVSPITSRGDTIKALRGDMNGFWRYRIGDFRLVYYPDEATHTVTLCDFASRGSAYD